MKIHYKPIGIIHSPFKDITGMPIQPGGASGVQGSVEVFAEYAKGLKDLEGFSHIILLYHFHRARQARLVVTPFLDSKRHGLFATRAPSRPNAIGLSVVKLVLIQEGVLSIEDVDIVDGTPLLDIKPYVPEFDQLSKFRLGWMEYAKGKVQKKKSDGRFR